MVSMNTIELQVSQLREAAPRIKAGDRVLLSGTVYTARDAAHKRFAQMMERGEELPFPIRDSVIYYAGPTGTPPHLAIGSCGPTTSGRMDSYSPMLLDMGLAAMVGKGQRSEEVCRAIVRNGAVYLCALGGAGALASKCITSCQVIAFEDLGCESVKKLQFEKFPLIAAIDCSGGNLFSRT
jgi:fumarate hydratase subunit beta